MGKKRTSYHHGDLRNALIATGVELLGEAGADVLSLRKVARRAGVSHNAPYQHFADKEALIAAIAEEGFHLLRAEVDRAVAQVGGDTQEQLLAAGRAYVGFALANPGYLQVMFGRYESQAYPGLQQAAMDSLNQLAAIVEAGQASGVFVAGEAKEVATAVWSLMHGVAAILTAQKMPPALGEARRPEEIGDAFLRLFCNGLLA